MAVPRFHSLRVAEIRRETEDCVSLAFAVPERLSGDYAFLPGQYLTLRATIGGESLRRSYSICAGTEDGELRVAVKRVPGGRFSSFVNDRLRAGEAIDVMTPEGRFHRPLDPAGAHSYLAVAAGSGITPVLSIARSVLAREPASRFTLLYGNRRTADIIFRRALDDLKDRHPDRFTLLHVLSREPQQIALMDGRIDAGKCRAVLTHILPAGRIDACYLCGPAPLIETAAASLRQAGVPDGRIRIERFQNPDQPAEAVAVSAGTGAAPAAPAAGGGRTHSVAVTLDGITTAFTIAGTGETVLDAALRRRPDMPYACKGGMCCTCRALLVEGEVRMDRNYTLAQDEIDRGFVLACQSRPVSDRVALDFDRR